MDDLYQDLGVQYYLLPVGDMLAGVQVLVGAEAGACHNHLSVQIEVLYCDHQAGAKDDSVEALANVFW